VSEQSWIDLGTLGLSVIVILVTGIWKLGSVRDELKEDFERRISEARREVIETTTSMRDRITQVEFYIRDNYVTKETFNQVLNRILAELETIREKMETNRVSVEGKLDQLRPPANHNKTS
jgi:hypothetical protein